MNQRNAVNDEEIAAQQRRATTSMIIAIVLIVIVAVLAWLWLRADDEPQAPQSPETPIVVDVREEVEPDPEPQPDPREEPQPSPGAEPLDTPTTEPGVEPEPERELPPLNESTSELLADLSDQDINTRPVRSSHVVRDLALFIQNLAEGEVIRGSATIGGPDARFQTQRIDDQLYIDESSYRRFDEIVDWFVNLDTEALMTTLEQYQPLFEQAFSEIAQRGMEFEDQLLAAIDMLLETPEPEGLLALDDERVMYTYADPELEQLPPAQKQMLRLGPENQQRVKAKLRDIRSTLDENLN